MERLIAFAFFGYVALTAICILVGGLCNEKLYRFGLILHMIFCALFIIAKSILFFNGV